MEGKLVDKSKNPTFYVCDPIKNKGCLKTNCKWKGGECSCTTNPDFAVLDFDGDPKIALF